MGGTEGERWRERERENMNMNMNEKGGEESVVGKEWCFYTYLVHYFKKIFVFVLLF